ncbi:M1 family metallopeptidase [Candidatus Saccharibacteria bacterium]|nr:M1 family metallopeptidase [Candidatus Saccharibacteria bacterium]
MQNVPRLTNSFKPTHYNLSLDIDRPKRRFSGLVTIDGKTTTAETSLTLHAKDLQIDTALIDGKAATIARGEFDALILSHDDLRPGKHVVTISFAGEINDSMHGIYPCYYQHEGQAQELIATQFESHHAREVFPCVDEPEAKATFDLTLTTEKNITVLSNLHQISSRQESDRLVTTFATTPRMSTYLLAWVYGDLQKISAKTTNDVEVNIYATKAHRSESLQFALDHAIKTIDFFDDYFQTPYPLPKSDHVALPDFSSAAMENWGLVTYRESCLIADPASASLASKKQIASIIAHELSHQWFGNLVTMKWWNDLWLNESFATLMSYIAVDAIFPEWNTWLDFSLHEGISALRRDAIDGVQSVQVDVNHPDEISSLFDPSIVYAKGARLMRMCQSYVGNQAFQEGLQTYFKEFAYQNTEANDLWKHLSKASGKDISNFMNVWIGQSGYPVVTVANDGLSQKQFFIGPHRPSSQLWPIPLDSNNPLTPALFETAEIKLPVADNERLNLSDSSHFITHYLPEHLGRILSDTNQTEINRLQILHEQTLLVRGGLVGSDQLIDLLKKYRHEASLHVWDIMALAFAELKKFVEKDIDAEKQLRHLASYLANEQYKRLGWSAQIGESTDDTLLRPLILGMMSYSEDLEVLGQVNRLYLQGIESIDPEIRPVIIASFVSHNGDLDVINQLLEIYRTTTSVDLQDDIASGITAARHPEQISQLIKTLTDTKTIRPQDNARWFVYLIRNRYAREATWQWMRQNWSWIDQQFGGDKSFDYYPRYAASGLMTSEQRDQYATFFSPKRDVPALTRVIDLGLAEIDARLELLDRDGEAVRSMLHALRFDQASR